MQIKYPLLLALLLLLATGCRDIHVKTSIKNNGEILRSYTVKQDKHKNGIKKAAREDQSQNKELPNLYFPIDTSWTIESHIDTLNNKKVDIYSKQFENSEAIQTYFDAQDYMLKPLSPKLSYKRNFRWFKTINKYSESYRSIFRGVEYKSVFSDKEIELIRAGKMNENDTIQKKFERWVAFHITDEIVWTVQNHTEEKIDLVDWKNIMYKRISMSDNNDPLAENNPFDFPELEEDRKELDLSDFDLLIETIEKYSNIQLSEPERNQIQTSLEQKMDIYMGLYTDDLYFSVKMPGKITQSNADSINGRTAHWKMSPFIVGAPFKMEAVSSQSNAGIVVTLAVILIIIIFIWLIRRKG